MKIPSNRAASLFGTTLAAIALLTVSAHAQTTYTFTGATSNEYTTASNWSGGVLPNLTTNNTAIINSGAVTYTPGGDLLISNGGTLEISGGSFTQVVSNNWIQLQGNGTILINGGTFNQGTSGNNPFNVTGTGNAFTISSGTANLDQSVNLRTGLTYLQSGGTINVTTGEFDFNNFTSTMTGGALNVGRMTGVNAPGGSIFNLSGGAINLSDNVGIYGGNSTQYINFTTGSTGTINFSDPTITTTVATGFLTSGAVEFNGTTNASLFNVTSSGGVTTISLIGAATPEPSTYALLGLGMLFLSLRCFSRKNHVS